MYSLLFPVHSLFRWMVLISLLYAIIRAFRGYYSGAVFSAHDNKVRHWTATIAHIQLILGMIVYIKSPVVRYVTTDTSGHLVNESVFFRYVHIALMMGAIAVITAGSALAKRKAGDREKYLTMLRWFGLGLLIILVAIPWPFSPLAQRPLIRF
ncbi:MAG TPA: hypothetical protein VM802_03565 [Chitinophaga sp.]|uniref:hypothetical protein n=1 Tax=Chitinophaga sp. TaxID=1869181 RepID=UPI002BA3F2E2|nr:hypothetical protein [Chitinophaga sp.]HVI43912.1 hypothetical protein [Chitinophaga sp.]